MSLPKGLPSEFYGDDPRWFMATVIDARPPEGEGLEGYVRVRIHGVHSPSLADIPESDLPWAQVLIPTTEGGTSGLGSTPRLEAGALVFGIFMDGKYSQVPIVIGSLPHITTPTPIQLGFDPINAETAGVEVGEMNLEGTDNENTGEITNDARERRQDESIKELLREGYDLDTAIAITAKYDIKSGMITGEHQDGSFGIDNFSGERLEGLKNSSPDYQNYDAQVKYAASELNTTQAQTKTELGNANSPSSKAAVLGSDAAESTAIQNKTYEMQDNYGGG